MTHYISLLRGINVSGQKKIKMAELKGHYESIGFTDVQTYIQSGNVLFKSSLNDETAIAKKILSKIKKEYGFDVPILITTEKILKKVIRKNPFLKNPAIDISKLHVTFMAKLADKTLTNTVKSHEDPNDDFIIDKQSIYVHCPNGYGRTKLTNNFFERKLKVPCTTRNWKTVNRLYDMCSA